MPIEPLRKIVPARPYLITGIEAALVAGCYAAAVWLVMPLEASIYLEYEGGAARIALVACSYLFASYIFDVYRRVYTRSRLVVALQLCQLVGILLLVQAGFGFVHPDFVLPQAVVLSGSALTLIAVVGWRLLLRPRIWNAFGAQKVIFIGWDEAVRRLVQTFQAQPGLGMDVAGILVTDQQPPAGLPIPVLGTAAELRRVVPQVNPDRLIAAGNATDGVVLRMLFELKAAGMHIETASQVHETVFGRIYSAALDPHRVIFQNDLAARPTSLALQSIYTNLLAITVLLLVSPLLVVLAAVLRLTNGGDPVFEKTECTGLHGIPFRRFRFNCRRGRVGALLQRLRLKGVPQAINLVRGEMALIGPQPERVAFDAELARWIPFYRQKHHVKPGVFGWSRLHRDVVSLEDTLARLEYDLYYIKHVSVVLDAYIMLRAIKNALSEPEASAIAERHVPVSRQVGY
jgi:lipopolysaccharide/colanic/teichoic acid biosynthesis glycosyltransferase